MLINKSGAEFLYNGITYRCLLYTSMCWLALFLFLSVSTRDKRDEINIFVAGKPCRKEYPMLKVFATQVVVSRGYDGAAAIKFSEKGDAVRFRIGKKVYDPNAENNARWINLAVKGFGPICERIKKMQLKDGSFVNLIGRLDEDCLLYTSIPLL